MVNQNDINEVKENIKSAEKWIKQSKAAIKEAERGSVKDRFIDGTLNAIDYSVRGICAGTHLGLKYSMDKVENIESAMARIAHGVDEEETKRLRQKSTAQTQLKIAQSILDFKNKIKNFSVLGNNVDEDVIKETVIR